MRRENINYFWLKLAQHVSSRSTCLSRKVGAVIVGSNGQIVSTGYNGAASGRPHCIDTKKCLRKGSSTGTNYSNCVAVHAEQNAIMQAGIDRTLGSTMYTTCFPCMHCARMIVNAKIDRLYSYGIYDGWETPSMYMSEAGVSVCLVIEDLIKKTVLGFG